jgi:NTE family protein
MLDGSYLSWFNQLRDRFVSQAQPPAPEPPAPPEPRRLGLALGGGGGKGAAHLGVLQVVEELGLPIDLLVGTSAGGAVAILYAAGLSLEQIREVFRSMSLRRIAVPDPTRTGLIGQRRRHEVLSLLLGDRSFADLLIPCAVTAVDLVSGQQVVIDEGPLVEAILATTALPGIFPPMARGEQLLADGGILNNLPVDVARARGAARVIAVELNDAVPGFGLPPAPADNPLARLTLAPQQFAVASRALSLLVNHATALHLRENPPDLLLSPAVAEIATLDMSNPERGYAVGVATAHEAAEALLALRDWRVEEPAPAPAPPPPPPEAPWPKLTLPFSLPRWGEQPPDQPGPPQA